MTMFLLAVFWGIWCTGHSILIRPRVQDLFRRLLTGRFRYYRLFYNGFALLSLLPVLAYSRSLKTDLLLSWQGSGLLVWLLLWGLVIYLGVHGARAYDMGHFAGLNQALKPETDTDPSAPLSRSGILSVIRHPWYLAALILFWIRSREIHAAMLVENLVLTVYIFIGIRLEEKELVKAYGNAYRSYQQSVPALIPSRRSLFARIRKP